jgi:hypothetical protein
LGHAADSRPWFVGRRVVEPRVEDPVFHRLTFFFGGSSRDGFRPSDDPTIGFRRRATSTSTRKDSGAHHCGQAHHPRAAYGFWPATCPATTSSFKDDARREVLARFAMLRQQEPIADNRPN